ncbi:sulfite oxidase [Jiangella asiatica]|uniref:Sulfite oxidase n=1 Tax=Jiangella asiatica TaxID=2530372 RepID=A0A4R5DH01_9ACTN|nr:sulfite oxidase [Jiangella asiatica]TDE13099.1 sulfite oxidase [Jiangella asiatica]
MSMIDESVSAPARVAEPGEGISVDELRLAARNHGMPLEALRYDVTPVGLHYLLTHYDIPALDPATWRLSVDGSVSRPLTIGLDDLHAREQVTQRVTLECAGNGRARLDPRPVSQPWLDEAVGTASWTGVRLADLLTEAGVSAGAVDVAFTGADRGVERGEEQTYRRGLPLGEALLPDVLLAYAMNGQPLPPQHGAPVRLVVPGWYGMAHVKWLMGVTVLDTPFDGYQNVTSYRLKQEPDDPGEPVTRILPKALIQPPGIPDFQSRTRIVDRGTVELTGRAWSGWAPVVAVEVSVNGGNSWHQASLGPQPDAYAWRAWTWTWDARSPGRYSLRARARDDAGNGQPVEAAWNRQGMANNHAQRVDVVVR